jgi:hypothetical protein
MPTCPSLQIFWLKFCKHSHIPLKLYTVTFSYCRPRYSRYHIISLVVARSTPIPFVHLFVDIRTVQFSISSSCSIDAISNSLKRFPPLSPIPAEGRISYGNSPKIFAYISNSDINFGISEIMSHISRISSEPSSDIFEIHSRAIVVKKYILRSFLNFFFSKTTLKVHYTLRWQIYGRKFLFGKQYRRYVESGSH